MDRRAFLRGLGAMGCSAAAFPLLNTMTLAAGRGLPGDHRLVVVILRGAMDGLDLLQPLGDADFARLRPNLGTGEGAIPLTNRFALHRSMDGLMPLWQAGQLGFVHATSTPYRDKRSHFDGQDLLEAGLDPNLPGAGLAEATAAGLRREGWLNRMLQAVPGLQGETAIAVGREALPLLAGRAPTLSWMPDQKLPLSAQGKLLLEHLYHDDPLFRDAAADAVMLVDETALAAADEDDDTGMIGGMMAPPVEAPAVRLADIDALVDFAAQRLRADTRIAALSLGGWDTHRAQAGAVQAPMLRLQRIVLRLRERLGDPVWGRTLFVAMTEFGRTVAENGSRGTDHGTGGAMVLAGGALRGGQVFGRWPGLAEADLYDRRDLMPTSDVRAWAAWAMRGMFGFDRALLEGTVFPGLDMGSSDPGLLL
ncbi:MAG: DUF1501 domain-containing protein [Paracoccaceae bacterium]|nr:MAG: DUF1501 domain-containing protein [Paracoccaceae bacterium]